MTQKKPKVIEERNYRPKNLSTKKEDVQFTKKRILDTTLAGCAKTKQPFIKKELLSA